ncbi:hypothetical protein MD484_g2881, partial [Candolleomyces efflorescens]
MDEPLKVCPLPPPRITESSSATTTVVEGEAPDLKGQPSSTLSEDLASEPEPEGRFSFEHVDLPEEVQWVGWSGPDDPSNPKNWSYKRKWATTFVVSAFNFISPASSSMIAPASETIAQEFGIKEPVLISLITSAFVLGYSVGPLVVGPLSEIYGRSRVIKFSNLFYLVWNLACGFSTNAPQLLVFRFLSGIGGSAPLSVGGAVMGDIFHKEQRGRAMALYSFVAMLGPVLGPNVMEMGRNLVDVIVQISGIFLLRETYPPVLLERKVEKLRMSLRSRGAGGGHTHIRSVYDTGRKTSLPATLLNALSRPTQLILFEPIIQLFSFYTAFVYGIFYRRFLPPFGEVNLF